MRIHLVGLFLLGLLMPADATERVALVIGNASYKNLARLDNPTRDAEAVASLLRANGFDVFAHQDLERADLLDALDDFAIKSRGAELALIFYAGHGMEVAGRDVIAPVDMDVACEPREVRKSVGLDALFAAADGAHNRVVLLDACRSDPFPMCPTRGRDARGFRGLARISSPGATLIANATLAGEVAADGNPGSHSPFTKALLARFADGKTVPFRDLLDQVAEDVRISTAGAQVPEVTSRGGAPRLCLAGAECGGTEASARIVMLTRPPAVKRPSEYEVGTRFRDCPDCPEMVVVPAGTFLLGSPESEVGHTETEAPQQTITLPRPFAVARNEITFDQWETCALEGGCPPLSRDSGWGRGARPVIYVSHAEAEAYAAWLTASTGSRYRLLTEAEWEYAARGGTTSAFATGDTLSAEAANIDTSLTGGLRQVSAIALRTREVGSYPPNPFGLNDMHGNVAEWVADCWSDNHRGAPGDGSARGGDCTRRVVKGGGWYFEPQAARSAARMSYPADKRLNVVGFRVARELDF